MSHCTVFHKRIYHLIYFKLLWRGKFDLYFKSAFKLIFPGWFFEAGKAERLFLHMIYRTNLILPFLTNIQKNFFPSTDKGKEFEEINSLKLAFVIAPSCVFLGINFAHSLLKCVTSFFNAMLI